MFEQPTSRIYDLSLIDAEDEFELELSRLYAKYQEAAKNKSEIEIHNYLQDKASQNKREYNEVVSALLYGVLTEPGNARSFFQSISFVNRDNFSVLVNRLQVFCISIKFQQVKLAVREQIFWLISELTSLNVQIIDTLYLCLLRQIKGGDTSQRNVLLCEQILKLCEAHKSWLDVNPRVIATFVYTYLRVIADHKPMAFHSIQQREIRFVIALLLCVPIGRDLARVLHDLASIPEFGQLWEDILKQPQKLSPRFKGIDMLLLQPTPKEFLRCRLTPDMEHKLLYIVQNLKINMYQRNLNWFIQRFLSTAEMEPNYVDVIRYLVAGWYPSNQILQSDIVPRYVVIGSLIRSVKSNVVAANIKLALIYDWLFFTSNDNIMFIEPAMLLMERSAERYPYITAMLMEFLKYAVDEYYPPMKEYMSKCVSCGMKVMLSKGVIRSLLPLYKCPTLDPVTRDNMKILFPEFLIEDPSAPIVPMPKPAVPQPAQATTPGSESKRLEHKEEEESVRHAVAIENDADVDEFLYGESESKNTTPKQDTLPEVGVEDEPMEDAPETTVEDYAETTKTENNELDTKSTQENLESQMESMQEAEEEKEEEEEEEEEEKEEEEEEEVVNVDEGLQSDQSYWIFGDSLKRFKDACSNLINAQKSDDEEEYTLQLVIAKRSIKDIVAVFLKMAIPTEVLVPTISPFIRNMVFLNRYPPTFVKESEDTKYTVSEDVILSDISKDVFDFLMTMFWNLKDKEAESEKMVKLLSCIAQGAKSKKKKHLIGMRWWSFISKQIERDEDENRPDEWFPDIVSHYETYVMHVYTIEKSTEDVVSFLGKCLTSDLQSLAAQNVIDFNNLIPLLYRYLPNVLIGNLEVLKLTLMMLLPSRMGQMVCDLHCGTLQMFGEHIDPIFVETSLAVSCYETMCFWQLLAAELQGKTKLVRNFFAQAKVVDLLKTQLNPTEDLLYNIISIASPGDRKHAIQTQFIIASLQHWSTVLNDTFTETLLETINGMVDQIENEGDTKNTAAESLIHTLILWWNQKLMPESVKSNKRLLSDAAKLAGQIGISCPKEWSQDSDEE
ncbi:hypothetical protein BCV72DRAFT_246293 [Rhizopus microsporus var. microsporus]|uniref:Integrator complex subunit 3 n=1 Tax=Rhizopus microsporus var. microsporus TaxID=86635 RepID=A0A1X0QMG3_RHIZD|nr:hypothetical protein BCV72DRAFT_246293 [Rhizopus microsporus var. microsporus]